MQTSDSREKLTEGPEDATPHIQKSSTISGGAINKRPTVLGRTPVSITAFEAIDIFSSFFYG